MSSFRLFSLVILVGITVGGLVTAATVTSAPTIVLEKAVHFLTPGGEDVVVGPGTFEVEAMKEGLRLMPKDGKPEDAKLIQAQATRHGAVLAAPRAESEPGVEDEHRIALLMPDGTSLEARGSYSGVRPRGGFGNTATGSQALGSNTTGSYNTAMGQSALASNTTGQSSTAMGFHALYSNNGNNNTATGSQTLVANTTGYQNTATGQDALYANTFGNQNTATGARALYKNTGGMYNTATGTFALFENTKGSQNTAMGIQALYSNNGSNNTAMGAWALQTNTTGSYNTASGFRALEANSLGYNNTAIGYATLLANTTGHDNTAIGQGAGSKQTIGNNNIYVNHAGISGESGTIRIGTHSPGGQTRAFLAGITGVAMSGVPVVVDVNGQLGVAPPSSKRYKTDIHDLGTMSDALLKLRPVSFRYKPDAVVGADARPRDYGLIAEEVAEVYPDLVTYGPTGEVETVRYDQLIPMLLNELQEQHREIQKIEEQKREIETLRARLAQLEARQAADGS